jgi:hypothetical protein
MVFIKLSTQSFRGTRKLDGKHVVEYANWLMLLTFHAYCIPSVEFEIVIDHV